MKLFFLYLQFILYILFIFFFFFQAEDGIRDRDVTGVQTCALPISSGIVDSYETLREVCAARKRAHSAGPYRATADFAGSRGGDPSIAWYREGTRGYGADHRRASTRLRPLWSPLFIADAPRPPPEVEAQDCPSPPGPDPQPRRTLIPDPLPARRRPESLTSRCHLRLPRRSGGRRRLGGAGVA